MKQKIKYLGIVFVFILIFSGCINKEIEIEEPIEQIQYEVWVEEQGSVIQTNNTSKIKESMRQFEIIRIDITDRIEIDIEFLDDRSKQRFVYALNQGWEIEIDGEQKFIRNIKQRVSDGEFDKKVAEGIDIDKIKKKYEGKKFK